MTFSLAGRRFAVLALAALCVPGVASGGIYTPGFFGPPPDSSGGNPANPIFRVTQDLPVGDTMTATFTHNGAVIQNADGSTPAVTVTVLPGTQGASFSAPGVMDGLTVTDLTQTHTTPGVGDGTIQIGAFQGGSMTPLGTYVLNAGAQTAPDFLALGGSSLFYGVDLVTWANQAFSVGSTYSIVNGLSASLPGYLFSNSALTTSGSGWNSSSLYNGTVTLDSFHDLSIPEPSSIVLTGTAGAFALAIAWRRRRASAPRA